MFRSCWLGVVPSMRSLMKYDVYDEEWKVVVDVVGCCCKEEIVAVVTRIYMKKRTWAFGKSRVHKSSRSFRRNGHLHVYLTPKSLPRSSCASNSNNVRH